MSTLDGTTTPGTWVTPCPDPSAHNQPEPPAVLARSYVGGTHPTDDRLRDDIIKFVRWSANARDDTAEAIEVARALLDRINKAVLADHGLVFMDSAAGRLADLIDAVNIMDTKIIAATEREDGTTATYLVGDSTWHRVLAIARGSTSEAARKAINAFRDADTPEPGLRWANPKYVEFARRASEEMVRRLEHGRAKFGVDWDEATYTDADNTERFVRAGSHLIAALRQYREGNVGPDETWKRAADVANQAFMLADPARLSEAPHES